MDQDSSGDGPAVPDGRWYDADAGPLVRPYAMTGGRTKPGADNVRFDLLASGLVRVGRPVPPARLPAERILREVIDGLRAL